MTENGRSTDAETPSARELFYRDRITKAVAEAEELGARSRLVSNLRGLSFAAALVLGLWALFGQAPGAVSVVALVLLLCFFGLVVWHGRVLTRENRALRWVQVNRDAQARCGSGFTRLRSDGASFTNPIHPYADDLDLFGKGSMFQKLCAARTQFGQARLAAFLMNRATPGEVLARQQAGQELAPLLELRQELESLALGVVEPLTPRPSEAMTSRLSQAAPDPEILLGWAESKPSLRRNKPLLVVAYVAPPFSVAIFVLAMVMGWHPITWITPLIGQAIILLAARPHTATLFAAVSAGEGAFLRYGPMLKLLEELPAQSAKLQELKALAKSESHAPPSTVMRSFERIVGYWELRHNGLVYPVINGVLLWDIHCALRLEAWQLNAGKHLRAWFHALGELEALSSLAGFAADHPDFCWPEVKEGRAHLVATFLGHPLIPDRTRVCNDVQLAEPGRALLVTGSNMSGKSTLLRAIGLNTVLALMGAPVCAERFSVTPVLVRTSMRVSDSLEEGVSHFYAEIRKLKAVLDSLGGSAPVLFLLDEILHGTNSRERQIGARWVLAELLKNGAMGVVSTHDAGLCELPANLMGNVEQVHLRETVEGGEMTFDYLVRPGPVKSGNALMLMQKSGINVPLE